jgi:hypothetical protein
MQMFPKSRAGAVRLATPLMIVSFLAMAGFLYWLSTYEVPEVVVDDSGTGLEDGLNEVAFADFVVETQGYMGEEITMRLVEVNSTIGDRLFWTMLPGGNPYLMHISEEALADSVEVLGNRRVDITGSVMALSDSLLDVWMESGVLRSEGDRLQTLYALDKGDYFRILRFEMEDEGESGDESGEPG